VTVDNVPESAMRDSAVAAIALADRWDRHFAFSNDVGGSWFNFLIDLETGDEFTSPKTPSLVIADKLYYVETMRYITRSKLLFFSSEGSSMEFRSIVDDSNNESFFPKLAWSDSVLYCVWSDDREGHWEVYFSKSTDGGESWSSNQRLSSSGVDTWSTALEARHDTLLVVWEDYRDGASSLYKKVSFDGGGNWSADHAEVTTSGISTNPDLAYGEGRYYMVWQDYSAGNWEVMFKDVDINLPVDVGGGEPGAGPMPVSLFLHQNYPNPFNPQTEIGFEVPGPGEVEVELVIYDLRGRLVKVLVDGLKEPGRYTVVWDGKDRWGRGAASGAYFYTVAVSGERMTRKMLLAK